MDVVTWISVVVVWGVASGSWVVFGCLVLKNRRPKDALEDAIDTSRKWRQELMADWDREFRRLSKTGEFAPGVIHRDADKSWMHAMVIMENPSSRPRTPDEIWTPMAGGEHVVMLDELRKSPDVIERMAAAGWEGAQEIVVRKRSEFTGFWG